MACAHKQSGARIVSQRSLLCPVYGAALLVGIPPNEKGAGPRASGRAGLLNHLP
jgi:hypothetical protein